MDASLKHFLAEICPDQTILDLENTLDPCVNRRYVYAQLYPFRLQHLLKDRKIIFCIDSLFHSTNL